MIKGPQGPFFFGAGVVNYSETKTGLISGAQHQERKQQEQALQAQKDAEAVAIAERLVPDAGFHFGCRSVVWGLSFQDTP